MHDITMSDHFKTLREPLIEQQKKTDEKQDKVIAQLEKNQLALISGIQDIMTLNTELPQLAPEDFGGPKELPAPEKVMANINKKFNKEEMELIKKNNLPAPSELLKLNVAELKDYAEEVKKISKKIGYSELGPLKRKKDESLDPKIEEIKREKEIINSYGETVRDVINFQTHYSTPKKGKGISKQPKRHAYKIQDGQYGGLVIDLPRLYNEMKLNVYRGGKLLYSADADKSLINLLTKRFKGTQSALGPR